MNVAVVMNKMGAAFATTYAIVWQFLQRSITMDETGIHHNTPVTKQTRSWRWFFWDARAIIQVDYFQKLRTIYGKYYANIS